MTTKSLLIALDVLIFGVHDINDADKALVLLEMLA